jgi:thioredoxin 1
MSEHIIELSDQNFDQSIAQHGTPTLVDFWAEWCAPCRTLTPVVEEIATQYQGKVKVAKMNVDQNTAIPGRYQVRAIPTLLLFNKEGEQVDQLVGLVSRQKLGEFLDKHLL